ncbi:SPFH domain-containing protein [Candidatus Margulisiibacteriota bacterium]
MEVLIIMFAISPFVIPVTFVILAAGLKVVNEYERGVRFTLGRYKDLMGPGLRFVWPVFQSWQRVDVRVKVVDVPDQDCMTRENISVKVNAVLYYKVKDSKLAILEVQHYDYAVSQLAQTTMRDVIGEIELDELLTKRDTISKRIKTIVDKATDPWGVQVESVELKHIELPQEMVRTMAKAAEAERERRAVIIKAEGEVVAAVNLSKAAKTLADSAGALHLRTLQSINDLSSDQSNTVVLAMPLEILRAFEGFSEFVKASKK